MATKTAIICNVCGFRLDGRVEGFPEEIEWTHPDRECRDFLRERNVELITALEALIEAYEAWSKTGRARYLERLALEEPAYKDAEALLARLKAS